MIKIKCGISTYYMVTSIVLLTLILYLIVYSFRGIVFGESYRMLHVLVFLIVLFTLIYGISLTPRRIILDENSLSVQFLFSRKKIEFEDISEIKRITPNNMDIRVFGISGLFGKIGLFYSRTFNKRYKAYVTDKNKSFYIIKKKGQILELSCSSPDLVIEKWNTIS